MSRYLEEKNMQEFQWHHYLSIDIFIHLLYVYHNQSHKDNETS